jgi:hypothetical protein
MRDLVEREDSIFYIPVLDIYSAMWSIGYTIDAEFDFPHAKFCRTGSRRSNDGLDRYN